MTRSITALVGVALIAIGCNQSSPPGGPGANKQQPAVGQGDNTFKLNAPVTETSIKQGETKEATLSISRGKNFTEDVKVEFSELPKGVTIMPATPSIKASDKDAKLTIEAAKDAALGHHVITVWGTPTQGEKTSVSLKIEVKAAS
jgi:uncharacterized membrane protein